MTCHLEVPVPAHLTPALAACLPYRIAAVLTDGRVIGADLDNLDPAHVTDLVACLRGLGNTDANDTADAIEYAASPDARTARHT